jgi:hypothetical protein
LARARFQNHLHGSFGVRDMAVSGRMKSRHSLGFGAEGDFGDAGEGDSGYVR